MYFLIRNLYFCIACTAWLHAADERRIVQSVGVTLNCTDDGEKLKIELSKGDRVVEQAWFAARGYSVLRAVSDNEKSFFIDGLDHTTRIFRLIHEHGKLSAHEVLQIEFRHAQIYPDKWVGNDRILFRFELEAVDGAMTGTCAYDLLRRQWVFRNAEERMKFIFPEVKSGGHKLPIEASIEEIFFKRIDGK